MRKKFASVILVLAVLCSVVSFPSVADSDNTFRLSGKVVLPGNDKAPQGGLIIFFEYRSDKGTFKTSDDIITSYLIYLEEGVHEKSFNFDIPYSTAPNARFAFGYSVSSGAPYWDRGYYSAGEMKYTSYNQTFLPEKPTSGLKITPLRSSKISGSVILTGNSIPEEMKVILCAETKGAASGIYDDFAVTKEVSLAQPVTSYSLKLPMTDKNAGYTVKYEIDREGYKKQGWYNSQKGTVTDASHATKIDVSNGERTGINLNLLEDAGRPLNPPDKAGRNFDLNADGRINIRDQVVITRLMGAVNKYIKDFDLNNDGVIDVKDLKIIKKHVKDKKFEYKNKYKYFYKGKHYNTRNCR